MSYFRSLAHTAAVSGTISSSSSPSETADFAQVRLVWVEDNYIDRNAAEAMSQTVWQYLVTFRQFGKILKVLGRFCGFLLFGNISNLLWQILYAAGQIFIDVNGHTSHIPSFDWTIIEECSADSVTSWFEEKVEKLFFKNRPKLDTADFTRNEMFFSWHDFWPIWAHF